MLQVSLVTTLGEKQPETVDLVLLDTDEFMGHFSRMLSRVLKWEKPGPEQTNGTN